MSGQSTFLGVDVHSSQELKEGIFFAQLEVIAVSKTLPPCPRPFTTDFREGSCYECLRNTISVLKTPDTHISSPSGKIRRKLNDGCEIFTFGVDLIVFICVAKATQDPSSSR